MIGSLGKYNLLSELSRDGDTVLYRAMDPANGRAVILQTIPLSRFIGRDHVLERFRRDARAVARLTHPHIVAVLASGEHGDTAFIAMDPADGQRLDERLADPRPLPWDEAVAILGAVLEALVRAHRIGVVHGALSPTAVRLTQDGTVRVNGFGLAMLNAPGAREINDLAAAGALAAALLAGHRARPGVEALLAWAAPVRGAPQFLNAQAFRDAVAVLSAPSAPARARRPGRTRIAAVVLVVLAGAGGLAWIGGPAWPWRRPAATVQTAPEAAVPAASALPAETGTPASPTPSPEPSPELPDTANTGGGTAKPSSPSPPAPASPASPPEASAMPPDTLPQPPPPDLVPPVAAVRDAVQRLPCTLLRVESLSGRILVSGTVAGEAARAAVHDALDRTAGGWDHGLDLAVASAGLCAPLEVMAGPRAANALLAAPLLLESRTGSTLHGGDPLRLDLTGAPQATHVRIDYFTIDGTVVHLLPNPLDTDDRIDAGARHALGDRTSGGRFWSVGPPFGQELITALATPTPLFAAPRPEIEPSAAYLAALKRALDALPVSSVPGPSLSGSAIPPPLGTALFLATAP